MKRTLVKTIFNDSYWGITPRSTDAQGYLTRVDSYLNRDYAWSTNGTGKPDARSLAIHEFGHWVNFKDDCSIGTSVMCWQPNTIKRSLTQHDQDELKAVYP